MMPVTIDQLIFVSYDPSQSFKPVEAHSRPRAREPGATLKIATRFARKNIQIAHPHEFEDFLALLFVFRRNSGVVADAFIAPVTGNDARAYGPQLNKIKHFPELCSIIQIAARMKVETTVVQNAGARTS
jgi:hypothetical protein